METKALSADIKLNDEGYLVDSNQWTEAIGEVIASQEAIVLTPRHWEVINFLRAQFEEGVKLSVRRVGKSGIVTIKEFYDLFPGGPLKKSSRIAGIPKPASCV